MNTRYLLRTHRRIAKRAARKYNRATADRHMEIGWLQLCETLKRLHLHRGRPLVCWCMITLRPRRSLQRATPSALATFEGL